MDGEMVSLIKVFKKYITWAKYNMNAEQIIIKKIKSNNVDK